MRITRYTDYALRVLIYLAVQPDQCTSIRRIADAYKISNNHLTKVAHQLKRHGYVSTVRGKNGGLTLARPAGAINIGAVVRDLESAAGLVECFESTGNCVITPQCRLQSAFHAALTSFMRTLDGFSLADLTVHSDQELRQLLSIDVVQV